MLNLCHKKYQSEKICRSHSTGTSRTQRCGEAERHGFENECFKGQSCLQISGHILDEFLTEIESLIECQVLFSSLNQETVLEDF